jgi:hypothetical protein
LQKQSGSYRWGTTELFFIRLFTETLRPTNLKRTVLGYCDTPL